MNSKPLDVQLKALNRLYIVNTCLQAIDGATRGMTDGWTGPTHTPAPLFEEMGAAYQDVRTLLMNVAMDAAREFGELWGVDGLDRETNLVAYGHWMLTAHLNIGGLFHARHEIVNLIRTAIAETDLLANAVQRDKRHAIADVLERNEERAA